MRSSDDISNDSISHDKSCQVLRLLLESGIDVDAVDATGDTALHLAVAGDSYGKSANADVVAELLKNGANASATRNDGNQPLQLAKCSGSMVLTLSTMVLKSMFPIPIPVERLFTIPFRITMTIRFWH